MKKHSRKQHKQSNQNQQTAKPRISARLTGCTVGLDVSDRYTYAAVVDAKGELVWEDRVRTREPELRRWLAGMPASVVALETGTHSRWMAKVARECRHQVLVANARELRLIYGGHTKTDRLDAEKLARLARVDPQLLRPIEHRGEKQHAELTLVAARDLAVKMRTEAINFVRGTVKSGGGRVPHCSAEAFTGRAREAVPELLRNSLGPMLETIDMLNERIREYDERIEHVARTEYPQVGLLTQVAGVGTLTALTFLLTVGELERFARSRDVGCYVGLRPKRDQSGESDPQLGITKAGNPRLRRMLVNCGHYILGRFGPDSDLRRWGLALAAGDGGKSKGKGKKRAVVAVARKLAVLLHRLLVTGEVYEPLRNSRGRGRRAAA